MRRELKWITLGVILITGLIWFAAIKVAGLKPDQSLEIPTVKVAPLEFGPFEPCDPSGHTQWSIISMPRARYTSQAERHNIVGTVRVVIYLMDTGRVDVRGVISSLPYGLTEEAVKAAKQIKFKPETQCGRTLVVPAEIQYDFPSGYGKTIRL